MRRGDSYLKIANQHQTTLDCMMHFNQFAELGNLYPGDKLTLMALNFSLVVDREFNILQLWNGEEWVKDYTIQKLDFEGVKLESKYTIGNKTGFAKERAYSPRSPQYRSARKSLSLKNSILEIGSLPTELNQEVGFGVFLEPEDMEELCLLLRLGNKVEIRL